MRRRSGLGLRRRRTGGRAPDFTFSMSEGTSCIAGVSAFARPARPISAPAARATVNSRRFMPRNLIPIVPPLLA
jgi:hypothetical protein